MKPKNGETNLEYLLRNMQPVLEAEELVFCSLPSNQAEEFLSLCQGFYVEREGTTIILGKHLADMNKLSYDPTFKRISLQVYSSLEAVGFLSRITEVLAAQGISVNVVSAYYHDYLYIKSDQADVAYNLLKLWQEKLSE